MHVLAEEVKIIRVARGRARGDQGIGLVDQPRALPRRRSTHSDIERRRRRAHGDRANDEPADNRCRSSIHRIPRSTGY